MKNFSQLARLSTILTLLGLSLLLLSCHREWEVYSPKHKVYLSQLDTLNCEEYTTIAACQIFAFMFNAGHFKSEYSKDEENGKVTITTIFGDLHRTVPLRCGIDSLLNELVELDNNKGIGGRFGESFTIVGTRRIVCN